VFRSIIGSSLGGTLADPIRNYPGSFTPGGIFDRFPYLLPNIVCASVVVFGLIVGILFLEETHEDKQHRRDYGLELLHLGRTPSITLEESKMDCIEETLNLLAEDQLREYQSSRPSTASSSDRSSDSDTGPQFCLIAEKLSVRKLLFSRPIALTMVAYGILALYVCTSHYMIDVC
jgi:hypothetical protein